MGGNAGEQETRKESEQLSARYFSSRVTAEGEGEWEEKEGEEAGNEKACVSRACTRAHGIRARHNSPKYPLMNIHER